jgi:two-component system response regulator PilR (NtrC family)
MEKPIEGITPDAMGLLEAYDWPGNVRELENTMERSVALETGSVISAAVLPEKIRNKGTHDVPAISGSGNGHAQIPEAGIDLEKHIQELEKAYILTALETCDGVGTRAAELLKMTYRSFRHYSKKYNIR